MSMTDEQFDVAIREANKAFTAIGSPVSRPRIEIRKLSGDNHYTVLTIRDGEPTPGQLMESHVDPRG